MTNQIPRIALCVAGLMLATLLSAGCGDHGCVLIAPPSSTMTLKLHLPPEHDVAMPETVKVCQSLVECETGTVPLVGANGAGFEFGPPFSLRGPLAFPLSMATGDLELNPGAVRLLRIQWPLDPKENNYQVDVRDANGVQTGKLNNDLVSYTHVTDQQCGVDYWTGSASD